MIKVFCLVSCVLLSGCATSNQSVSRGGHFVDVGAITFVVFAQEDNATAIRLTDRPVNFTVFAQMAVKAISYATKCGIEAGSLQTDGKSFYAALDCVRQKMTYLKAAQTSRKLSGYRLPGLSELDLAYLRTTEGDVLELGHP
jgi:hypothetical protein